MQVDQDAVMARPARPAWPLPPWCRRLRRRRRRRRSEARAAAKKLQADADRRRQGRRVLHHDELRGPGGGEEARREPGLPGPRRVRRRAADTDRERGRGEEARRDPGRADRHQGDVRTDQAGRGRRVEDRARGHHARELDLAVSQIASDNEGGRQGGGGDAVQAHRGQGQGVRRQRQARASRPPTRARRDSRRAPRRPGLDYIGQEYSQDDPARAASIVKSILAKNPDLKGIFATNLFSAEGQRAGCARPGKLGEVKIVGFDAGPKQVEDLKQGLVQALIAQRPAQIGSLGVQQAVNALDDKPVRSEDRDGLRVDHEGQPRPEPGRALQGELLSRPAPRPVRSRIDLAGRALRRGESTPWLRNKEAAGRLGGLFVARGRMARAGIEPATPRFSVVCSTN